MISKIKNLLFKNKNKSVLKKSIAICIAAILTLAFLILFFKPKIASMFIQTGQTLDTGNTMEY